MTPYPSLEQLATLLPLALAAGLDFPLTLLMLGSAQSLGFQVAPPGELGLLAVPEVLVAAGVLWALEFWAERRSVSALGWNVAQGLVRPLAGALLALLVLPEAGIVWRGGAAFLAGAVALGAQAGRAGWRIVLDLAGTRSPSRLVVSAAEDAGTLALVTLALDTPLAAGVLAVLITTLGAAWARPALRAYRFGLRLVRGATWGVLAPRRWSEPARFPRWVRRGLSGEALGGGGLRGTRAGALAHPGLQTFRGGWVVVRGGSPLFLYRRGGATHAVDLGAGRTLRVLGGRGHNRVELEDGQGRTYALCFPWDGPRVEGLEAEFLV